MLNNFKFGRGIKKSPYEQLNDILTEYNRRDIDFTNRGFITAQQQPLTFFTGRSSHLLPTMNGDPHYTRRMRK